MIRIDSSYFGFLEDGGCLSVQLIRARGWAHSIFPDFPDEGKIGSFCEALESAGINRIVAISVNGNEVDRSEVLSITPAAVLGFLTEQSYAEVFLSGDDRLFLFKDASDRFFICFGDHELVRSACGNSAEESDRVFIEWVRDGGFNASETDALMKVFEKFRQRD